MKKQEGATMSKDTSQLKNELSVTKNIDEFIANNQENFREYTLGEYLNHLLSVKNLSKAEVIQKSCLEQTYAYHIFAGRKKNPSRNKVLSIALAMQLSPDETQYLLYYAGAEQLYVRNSWDSVLWYALENHLTVLDTDILLSKLSEKPLLRNLD